jgi:hypothetical protein
MNYVLQLIVRLSLPARDKFVYQLLHGKEQADIVFSELQSKLTAATNILTEQLIENSAILLSMCVMWFFQDYKVLFNFGGFQGNLQ